MNPDLYMVCGHVPDFMQTKQGIAIYPHIGTKEECIDYSEDYFNHYHALCVSIAKLGKTCNNMEELKVYFKDEDE